MSDHRIYHPLQGVSPGQRLTIGGEEAQHAARVKRLEVGDEADLFDGQGRMAVARVEAITKEPRTREWQVTLTVQSVQDHTRPPGRVDVWSAVPKGGRLDDMIDGLSQVGARAWGPLDTARGVAEAGAHKRARLDRIVLESAKQCGRPWILTLEAGGSLRDGLAAPLVIIADASGTPLGPDDLPPDTGVRVLIGPEGGWTPDELASARAAGARAVCFGPHVMRIETAAIAAAAIVLDHLRSTRPRAASVSRSRS